MSTYELLDRIADAVNPLLLISAMTLPALPRVRRRIRLDRWYLCIALCLALVYGLMYVDTRLSLWSSIGADYSTHTAFALGMCLLIGLVTIKSRIAAACVFLAYTVLMHYQGYHTLVDMVTTSVVVGAAQVMVLLLLRPRRHDPSSSP